MAVRGVGGLSAAPYSRGARLCATSEWHDTELFGQQNEKDCGGEKRANYGSLSTFEIPGTAAEGGGSHDLGYIAADYIAATYGPNAVNGLKNDYWAALAKSDWRTAFANTFGIDPDQFYANFESYRNTL